jgi:beta-fructofuranosidase
MNRITPCGYISVDTSHASLYPDVIGRIPDSTRFLWDGKEKVNVRIFVDKCMVEVFVNDKAALCQMAYASLPESDMITVEALGGDATVENVTVYDMESIY